MQEKATGRAEKVEESKEQRRKESIAKEHERASKNNFQVREYNASPKLALTSTEKALFVEKVKRKKIKTDVVNIKLINATNKSVEYSNVKKAPAKSKAKNTKKVKVASRSPQKDNL